jgi:hypothetical protein
MTLDNETDVANTRAKLRELQERYVRCASMRRRTRGSAG